ncbi:Holliday junction branch migration protein RuvA [Phormidium yuhuli AB48]|uniref:Holliday junction branch migration complex subunit RuvA n=1 Tax=Phormidium yuhuli AB48 TaxID=2940671 RepID=A0ABY5APP1_9CYAN|nr:Holliday junction branch migration protein RuvA [Phormidium yuhuli]USR91157.1 Holliday junction branch migration protein RuvA [Phormidium yuhuli AB48]
MFSYLKGLLVGVQMVVPQRPVLTLEVNGLGYEVQITPRFARELPKTQAEFQVFVDLQLRDDRLLLFGFATAAERDLFRQLIRASGVGAQLAMALLSTLALEDLVQAIISGNHKILSQTPGVGKKTAERISLELRETLDQWREQANLDVVATAGLAGDLLDDVEMTLLALGYSPQEVVSALNAVSSDLPLGDRENAQAWIKDAISWLSREVAN